MMRRAADRGRTSAYYPVHLDLRNRRCIVVGGGQVAERKVRSLVQAGASVTVISPALSPALRQLAEERQIEAVQRDFQADDLAGGFLVVAATDQSGINRNVALEAERRNLLCNVVDDATLSNFILPSVLHQGNLVVTVSTSGLSPALARKLRRRLEGLLGPEYAVLLDLVAEVRSEMKRRGTRVDAEAWQEALDDELMALVNQGMIDQARERMFKMLDNATSS